MQFNSPRMDKGRLTVTSCLLAGSLLLAACAGGSSGSATATAEQPPAAAEATSETTSEATVEATAEAATEATTEATTDAATDAATETAAEAAATVVQKLNLNEVTGEELLATIPNFGDRMVREFMEYRPYVSIQEFRREIGKYVDAAQVAEYEQYVYVPIDVNEADEATLQQLPGVEATAAAELAAGRPYASNDAFLQKLAEVAPQADVAAAAAYLVSE